MNVSEIMPGVLLMGGGTAGPMAALTALGEIAAILPTQHHLCPSWAHGPFAMGGQDAGHRDRRFLGLIDQTVIGLDLRALPLADATKGAIRHLRPGLPHHTVRYR